MVEPVPTSFALDPLVCLTEKEVLEACRFVAEEAAASLSSVYRAVADNRTSYVADFDRLVCPFLPICDPVIDGIVVRYDDGHITPKFAVSLAGRVAEVLVDNRLIPG
jgi:hypothetical protein